MAKRDDIVEYINKYLNSALISDSGQNGLQVEGKAEVKKIVFGVSASVELFKRAAAAGADMVITHHGLFWSNNPLIIANFKDRIAFLLKHDINLAAWHLPLDMHKTVGNNAVMAAKLGLKNIKPFGSYHGIKIGFGGTLTKELTLAEVENKLGLKAKINFPFGKPKVKSIAIVSGGGHSAFAQAAQEGYDLFITGSSEEYVQENARECKINYIGFGHYATETFGITALMAHVSEKFKVKTEFIDVQNPV